MILNLNKKEVNMNIIEKSYTELYKSNEIQLNAYSYIQVLKEVVFKVNIGDYAGKCTFSFSNEQVDVFKKVLQTMYETLEGECIMEDCDFGNKLRLFFKARALLIEGNFFNGVHRLTFRGRVDQTIIPPLISLLKN